MFVVKKNKNLSRKDYNKHSHKYVSLYRTYLISIQMQLKAHKCMQRMRRCRSIFYSGKTLFGNSAAGCSPYHLSLYNRKYPEAHFSGYVGTRWSLINQLVKRSREMSVVALGRPGQIKYGAGFDRLISSPK